MEQEQEKYEGQEHTKSMQDKVLEISEQIICDVLDNGVSDNNIDFLGKIIDIHKDISNEEYWKMKEDMYMYREYDNYNARRRDSSGRYMNDSSYGRRGVPGSGRGRYRGENIIDQMYRAYNGYMTEAEYGNYGTSESMMKIEVMTDSLMDFVDHLKQEAKTPEERQLIDQKIQELSRM